MPGTVKSELLPDADRSHKCDCQEKVSWKRNLPLDKSHFITEMEESVQYNQREEKKKQVGKQISAYDLDLKKAFFHDRKPQPGI